jgi:hypothetical protein
MIQVKDRPLQTGQRVQVYYNLHQGGYSIKDKRTGLVVGYANNVLITKQVKFKVQQAGRRKTIQEKRKRVHAYIEGDFQGADMEYDYSNLNKVYYNPYETEHFTDVHDGSQVHLSTIAFCTDKVCYTD